MTLDKFIQCDCGKKKKITWLDKAEFKRGEHSFCVGFTECPRCLKKQQHYSGNFEDIQKFITYMENQLM